MISNNQTGTISQTGRDITQQPLPDIIKAVYHTQKPSLSPYYLEAQHLPWPGFENEVRRNFERQNWGTSIISVRRAFPDQFDIVNEMFQCGDELSLSGRFVQQVLHVTTAIGRDLNIPVRFGDFKTVYTPEREKQRLEEERRAGTAQLPQPMSQPEDAETKKSRQGEDPDFAAVNNGDRVRFVGEIKTPWTQIFEKGRSIDSRWRRWIGQTAQYMKTCNLRYGFWTTYRETVFLKQEQSKQGEWLLRVSNIIKFDTKSGLTRRADDNLNGRVSLRECMLFLICETNGPDSDVYVHNDDEHFIQKDGKKNAVSAIKLKSKTARKLLQPAGASPEEIKARKEEAQLEQQSRLRQERAAKREMRPPVSGPPLGTLPETIRDRSLRRPSPSSASQGQTAPASEPSSRASSKSRNPQTRSEAKGKQKVTHKSPERRVKPDARSASQTGQAEASRARSISSQRRGRQQQQPPPQSQHGVESDDLYGVSDDEENRPPMTLSVRPSRGQSPPPPLPQPPSAPAAPQSYSEEASTQRSTRRRPQRQQQQEQQEPRSPIQKLKDRFHKR